MQIPKAPVIKVMCKMKHTTQYDQLLIGRHAGYNIYELLVEEFMAMLRCSA